MNGAENKSLTISSIRRIHGRAVLTLSSGEMITMPRALLRERPYKTNMPFDREAHDAVIRDRSYAFAVEKALSLLRDCFGEFSKEELESLRDQDAVEWAYINGEVHYKNNFLGNLIKTRPQFESRVKDPNRLSYKFERAKMLNENMERMKKNGSVKVRFHMRSQMTIDPLPGREGQKVYAHLPLPIEYAQVKNFNILSVSHPNAVIAPSDYPQRTICFHEIPDRPFTVEYTYENH